MPAFGLPFWVLLNRTGTGEKRRAEVRTKTDELTKREGKTRSEIHKGGKTNKKQVKLTGQSKKAGRKHKDRKW